MHNLCDNLILFRFIRQWDSHSFQSVRIHTGLIIEICAQQLPVADAQEQVEEIRYIVETHIIFYGICVIWLDVVFSLLSKHFAFK